MLFASYFPKATKHMREDTFELFCGMSMLKYNWCHFNQPWCPAWVRKDPVLHQKAALHQFMAAAGRDSSVLSLEAELVKDYHAAAAEAPQPKRRRRGRPGDVAPAQIVDEGVPAFDAPG